jgi:hypothetical protein
LAPTPNDAGPPAHDGAFGRAGFAALGNGGNALNRAVARAEVPASADAAPPAAPVAAVWGTISAVRSWGEAMCSRATGAGETPNARPHTSTAHRATSGCKYLVDTI